MVLELSLTGTSSVQLPLNKRRLFNEEDNDSTPRSSTSAHRTTPVNMSPALTSTPGCKSASVNMPATSFEDGCKKTEARFNEVFH